MESQALATQTAPSPAAIEQIRNTSVVPVASITRSELTFFADMIEAADLIPFDRNTPKAVQKYRVMAKIVAGAAHGFDPISSQENLHVIQGRCVLSARGMAIKLRRTGQYDTRIAKLDDDGCKLEVLEKNAEGKFILKGHVEFTKAHADKAGLLKSNASMYDKWGQDMFYANAIKRVCRRFAPETLDTEPLNYRLSKEAAAVDQAVETRTPQQIATTPPPPTGVAPLTPTGEPDFANMQPGDTVDFSRAVEVGETYQDQEYTGTDDVSVDMVEADFIEAEAVDADPELDTATENLRSKVQELLSALPAGRQKDIQAGKTPVSKANFDELTAYENELTA